MTPLEALSVVRKLAKTHDYQVLYVNAKELNFQIFKNKRDFSSIQISLLGFLNLYSTICMDVYLKEVDEIVLDNEIYEDAYLYYKQKLNKKDSEPITPIKSNKTIERVKQIKSTLQYKRKQ